MVYVMCTGINASRAEPDARVPHAYIIGLVVYMFACIYIYVKDGLGYYLDEALIKAVDSTMILTAC